MLAQSVIAMTTLTARVLARPAGDRSTVSGVTPLFIQQTLERGSVIAIVFGFFRVKKVIGRTEMRTHKMMYCQSI